MREFPFILLAACFFCTAFLVASAQKTEEKSREQKTLLFVDNQNILYYAGIERNLRPLTRHKSNPVIGAGGNPWEDDLAYCSVYRDSQTGLYQMWYQSYVGSQTPDKSLRCVVCYAESQDGIHWDKPDLELFPFYNEKTTNIVLLSNEGPSTRYGASVIVNPDESEPSRRYKMAYWDFVEKGEEYAKGLCVAFSPDGIHWTKHTDNPVLHGPHGQRAQPPFRDLFSTDEQEKKPPLSHAISDVIDVAYDPTDQKYFIYSKTWIDGPKGKLFWKRAVVRTESQDFVHWSRPQLVMWPDEYDDANAIAGLVSSDRDALPANKRENVKGAQLHGGPAFIYHGIYFSLLQVLDLDVTGLMPTELAISRDGLHWERPFRETFFLPVDGGNDFDSGTIWSNATPIVHEDEIWFYYGSYVSWHLDLPQYKDKMTTGIGLATMPLDRFAGLEPIEQYGQVTLKPMELDGHSSITINADATSGSIQVELMDEDGYRIQGFSKEEAVSIRGDDLRHEVRWKNNKLSDLPDGEYVLRIHLDNANLYAITLLP